MANPNDAVGTNGAFGGRTSVNAFNDVLSAFSGRGIISGWSASPSSGLTINLGGNGNDRDVAIAEDAAGNKTTVNNISQAPVQVTVNAAPASNSRIDAVVAYIEDSPSGSGVTDNPDVVNLLVVSGTVASSPTIPTDSAIRSAITADGASGSTAYYVILASVRISAGTTDVDSTMINAGPRVSLNSDIQFPNDSIGTEQIANGSVNSDKIDFTTFQDVPLDGLIAHAAVQAGFGTVIEMTRVGNLVYASGSFVVSSVPAGESQTVSETIPNGYRPISATGVPTVFIPFEGFGTGTSGAWELSSAGTIKLWIDNSVTGVTRFMYGGAWLTEDDFPTS